MFHVGCSIKTDIFFLYVVTLVTASKVYTSWLFVGVFLLLLWNPEIKFLKIACGKMSDEKSKNLHDDTRLNSVYSSRKRLQKRKKY